MWIAAPTLAAMAVQVDTSRALRRPDELAALVAAVMQALETDELDWIEWKSTLDLSTKPVQGTLARHILGMANRQPDAAAPYLQGCGYIVVGAEPGSANGITPIDPAHLSQGILAYSGSDGPAWSPQYVEAANAQVLVLVIESPRPGDRIFTLRREFTSGTTTYRAGTVFVRKHGKTEAAGPDDIRALEDRYAAPGRLAEAHARQMLEIEKTRHEAEEIERRRRWLAEMARLAAAVIFKAQAIMDTAGVTTAGATGVVTSGYFRCAEQLELQSLITGMDMSGLEAVSDLAGDGQAHTSFAAASRARVEIEAAMHKLQS
jgi:hypothetical protein